jgi:hypothetical protein
VSLVGPANAPLNFAVTLAKKPFFGDGANTPRARAFSIALDLLDSYELRPFTPCNLALNNDNFFLKKPF